MIRYKIRDSDWLTFPLIIVNFNHFFIQSAPGVLVSLSWYVLCCRCPGTCCVVVVLVFLGFTRVFCSQSACVGVNPKCIDDYAVLEGKDLTKLHIFAAKHKVNTYSEKLSPSDDCASIWSWPPVKLWRYVKPKNCAVVVLSWCYAVVVLFLCCRCHIVVLSMSCCCPVLVLRTLRSATR